MAQHEDGWFSGFSPIETLEFQNDDEYHTRKVDTGNVVGRFRDHNVIDGVASEKARKSVYKSGIILETKSLRTAHGAGSDVSSQPIRFDPSYAERSAEAIVRFKEAWLAYQKKRKAPVTDEEKLALDGFFPGTAKPKRKPQAKAKAKTPAAENVVTLQKATA